MTRLIIVIFAAAVVATVAVLGIRGQSSDRPPLQAFDDMADQPKYKSQGDSRFFADARAMRTPRAGAVPWGRGAASPDDSLLGRDQDIHEADDFPSFVKLDRPLLDRGRSLFSIYCAPCHGLTGSGDGITTQYGMGAPTYHTDIMRALAVGHIYQVITEGKGLMGPYGERIDPADRWPIIAYVRALQRAGNARIDDVPEPHRRELRP